jgi:hypothetical protein
VLSEVRAGRLGEAVGHEASVVTPFGEAHRRLFVRAVPGSASRVTALAGISEGPFAGF